MGTIVSCSTEILPPSPFLPITRVGICEYNKRNEFEFTADGAILQMIRVWVGESQLNAVKIWLTNGKEREFGNPSGDYKEHSFQPDETISSMSLWVQDKVHLGGIQFKTNKTTFIAKTTTQKKCKLIKTGSGICVGVTGSAGSGIDSMGFIFVKPIRRCVISSVEYSIELEEVNETMFDIKKERCRYKNNTKKTLPLKASITHTTPSTAAAATVPAGIPTLVPTLDDEDFGLTLGKYEKDETDEIKKFPIKVPANFKAMGEAHISIPYKANVKITTLDGDDFTFQQQGEYTGVIYTEPTEPTITQL